MYIFPVKMRLTASPQRKTTGSQRKTDLGYLEREILDRFHIMSVAQHMQDEENKFGTIH